MLTCPYCHREFEASVCGADFERSDADEGGSAPEWVSLARFMNLAEAGYVADLLRGHDIAAHVHERGEYDAARERTVSSFVLQVHKSDAQRALPVIEAERDQMEEGEAAADEPSLASAGVPGYWKGLALVLLAGAAAQVWFHLESGAAGPAPRRARGELLIEALSESRAPLSTVSRPGEERRRLIYIPAIDRVVLEEDVDGDGRYDRRREF